MALKDIRVTFFYADESVFAQVKQWRTRERIVKWANEFYKRFGFRIDEFPIPYNESVYKKRFSLSKKDGIKANYTSRVFTGLLELSILKERNELADEEIALLEKELFRIENNLPPDPAVTKGMQELVKKQKELLERMKELLVLMKAIPAHELQFRNLLNKKIKELKISKKKERLVVVFCWFVNFIEFIKSSGTIGETFDKQENVSTFMLWNFIAPAGEEVFTGPVILIGINKVTKKLEYVLAHEIVHAAGNTTQDNQGTAGNIMIYADAEGKAPSAVNLEATDKAKLETAFFVI